MISGFILMSRMGSFSNLSRDIIHLRRKKQVPDPDEDPIPYGIVEDELN